MFLLYDEPIGSLIFFSIVPIIGAISGYYKANQLKDKGVARKNEKFLQIGKGICIGILIELPLLGLIILLFNTT